MRRLSIGLVLLAACSGTDDGSADGGSKADASSARRDAGPVSDGGTTNADASVPGPGRWSSGPAIPLGPRQETGVVTIGNEFFVVGGYEGRQFGRRLEAYDTTTSTWRRAADLPVDLHHANTVAFDNRIYVLGYLVSGFQDEGRVFVYDPNTDGWTEGTPMPDARARGSSVVAESDGLLYVVGGLKNGTATADFDVYDPDNQTWRALPPIPRLMDHGAGGAFEGRIYVAGGRRGGLTTHTAQLDIFDVAQNTWTEGPAMPTGRAGTAGVFHEGSLFVFGGEGNTNNAATGLFDEVESYDVRMGAWNVHTAMDPAKHGTGAASIGGRIYIPGGADVQAFGAVDTLSVFEP